MAVCWSIALADRVNLLKAETEDANRALRSSEHRLSQILEGLPLGVVVYGKDQRPNFANRRVIEILSNPGSGHRTGSCRQADPGAGDGIFLLPGGRTAIKSTRWRVCRCIERCRANRPPADDIEADLVRQACPAGDLGQPDSDDAGNVESVVVAFQDITQRKNDEAELAEYRYHLESLVEQRTAQLNHEVVRTQILGGNSAKLIEWLSAINEIHQVTRRCGRPCRKFMSSFWYYQPVAGRQERFHWHVG